MMKNLYQRYKEVIAIGVIIALYCAVIGILGIGCPIKFFTGIPCMGCGMTRACIALLQFDFMKAWQYHPMVFLLPFIAGMLLFRNRLGKRENLLWGIIIILFCVVYLVRLWDVQNTVVEINVEEGLFYKLLQLLKKYPHSHLNYIPELL